MKLGELNANIEVVLPNDLSSLRDKRDLSVYNDEYVPTSGTIATQDYVNSAVKYSLISLSDFSKNLADHAINAFAMDSDLTVHFPDKVTEKCRDFLLFVTHISGELTLPNGTYYGDSSKMDDSESYLISLTEIAEDTWYTRTIKMEVPA